MLEKIAGVALITKQWAILLMEADFNCHNKLIFGKRMLDLASEYKLIPDKIYSGKGRTAEEAILQKVLAYDIAHQTRAPYDGAGLKSTKSTQKLGQLHATTTS